MPIHKSRMRKVGQLEIILGPMFSGKTTRLIEKYNECLGKGERVIAINYSADKRYHDTMLSTHDKKMIPCVFTEKLSTISNMPEIIDADIILINEGQFFGDIYEQVSIWVNKTGKQIYVCGLDGDFQQRTFGKLLDLIPLCDSVIKLCAKCGKCGKDASFSGRLSNELEQVVIGSDNYIALCRGCIL